MEKPGGAHFTLETLKRLAEAFDVALVVRFAPFSELLDWSRNFNPESFQVANFALECETECGSLTTKGNGSGSLLESIVDPVSQSKQNVVSIVDSDRYRANYEGWPVENVREGSQTAKGPAVEQATWGQDQGRRGSLCRS